MENDWSGGVISCSIAILLKHRSILKSFKIIPILLVICTDS